MIKIRFKTQNSLRDINLSDHQSRFGSPKYWQQLARMIWKFWILFSLTPPNLEIPGTFGSKSKKQDNLGLTIYIILNYFYNLAIL
jgi:hypothetical protein